MSDDILDNNEDDVLPQTSELDSLKMRADQLGLKYHPAIGVEKLREKVNATIEGTDSGEDEEPNALAPDTETVNEKRARLKREALKLVRVRITNMNPNKKEWEGEIFTVSNSVIGTVKKMIKFDVEYHVPQIILNVMRERECQVFVNFKDAKGNRSKEGKLVKEFAIEVLPSLTEKELKELAQRQAMANGVAN